MNDEDDDDHEDMLPTLMTSRITTHVTKSKMRTTVEDSDDDDKGHGGEAHTRCLLSGKPQIRWHLGDAPSCETMARSLYTSASAGSAWSCVSSGLQGGFILTPFSNCRALLSRPSGRTLTCLRNLGGSRDLFEDSFLDRANQTAVDAP